MLKNSSIEIIKDIYKEEEAVKFIENKCIDFINKLKAALTEEDTNESKSLLIDISLNALRSGIDREENEYIKKQMQDVYDSLYKVSINELIV